MAVSRPESCAGGSCAGVLIAWSVMGWLCLEGGLQLLSGVPTHQSSTRNPPALLDAATMVL